MPLSLTVTPGKQFTAGELVNNAKLNQLGRPTINVVGLTSPSNMSVADYSGVEAPGAYFYGVAAGTLNALTVTVPQTFSAYTDGMVLAVKVAQANSGVTTLNLNGKGAVEIYKFGFTDLASGDLQPGMIVELRYRLDANIMAGGSYGAGGTSVFNVVAGFNYIWSPGLNDTSITYTDGGGAHTVTVTTSFTPTTTTVTVTGTANLPMGGSLQAQTNFWELMTPVNSSPPNVFYTAEQGYPSWNPISGPMYSSLTGSVTHGLGSANIAVFWSIVCLSTEGGWSAGDELAWPAATEVTSTAFTIASTTTFWQNSTTAQLFCIALGASGPQFNNNSNNAPFVPTGAKWNLRCRVRRLDL